ncbi:hypothetical protein [Cellulomonas bogoriensis]|uniref:Uncharacterized protein n=1 Tax=Cellulomonas bogoriensis 69B4 = DSM 16987 TaxID=1386082 RepID=A0A0A0BJ42_9CELL|nr:hypothetical protein [Cellulomonas bogoriensis]KGM08528.1 hypothetical protein N869_10795 [Cellulomonas bogoriensis 69B4 = DSM 16987]
MLGGLVAGSAHFCVASFDFLIGTERAPSQSRDQPEGRRSDRQVPPDLGLFLGGDPVWRQGVVGILGRLQRNVRIVRGTRRLADLLRSLEHSFGEVGDAFGGQISGVAFHPDVPGVVQDPLGEPVDFQGVTGQV